MGAEPFEAHVRQVLDNLEAVATAVGGTLQDAVKVHVYLRDPARKGDFDNVYRDYVSHPPPARTLVRSDLPGIELEVDAVLYLPRSDAP